MFSLSYLGLAQTQVTSRPSSFFFTSYDYYYVKLIETSSKSTFAYIENSFLSYFIILLLDT